MKLFSKHPQSIGETYSQHLFFALKVGLKMIGGGMACTIHAIFPFLFQTTGSRVIEELQKNFTERENIRS